MHLFCFKSNKNTFICFFLLPTKDLFILAQLIFFHYLSTKFEQDIMTKEERHSAIINLLLQRESILVTELADILNVSSVTIRKDLTELEKNQRLYRNHGKAILMSPYAPNRTISEKEKYHTDEKQTIGFYGAQLIEPNDSIIIASGTSVHALARNIDPNIQLTAITASLKVSEILSNNDNVNIIQLGGLLRHSSLSVVGNNAEVFLSYFACSKLFLGVDGIDLEFGITTTDMQEASLNRVMMKAAQKTIVLADSSKFGRRGFSKISNMEDIDHIITDSNVSPAIVKQIEEMGIELTIAQ